jgi:2-haloacid dehalogenase
MTASRPSLVAFDLVETIFDLAPVAETLDRVTGSVGSLPRWFDRLLRDGFARSLAGSALPFREVAVGALEVTAPSLAPDERDAVLAAFGNLAAHPDVEPALQRLAGEGIPMVAVTNSGADGARSLLASAGLDHHLDTVISVEEVGVWKPHPAVYHHVATIAGRSPSDVALVAVHAWDTHGAGEAGLVTGWASRLEGRYASSYRPADVTGRDLLEVVEGLLALPAPT